MKETLKTQLKPLYAELLKDVETYKGDTCTFFPQWGEEYTNDGHGIMFFGRATNNWYSKCKDIDLLFDENNKECIFARDDQMRWVYNNILAAKSRKNESETRKEYNPNQSPFWRIIRKTTKKVFGYKEDEWFKHIVWSDLYKVSVQLEKTDREANKNANPTAELFEAQQKNDLIYEIMKKEIEIFNPKHIVLLTGGWSKIFLKKLNEGNMPVPIQSQDFGKEKKKYKINVYQINGRFFYATEHPQGKPEKEHIEKLVELIKTNK